MSEQEWLVCADPRDMLDSVQEWVSDRKLRLYACACARRVWSLLPHAWSRREITDEELYLEGRITDDEAAASRRERGRYFSVVFLNFVPVAADKWAKYTVVVATEPQDRVKAEDDVVYYPPPPRVRPRSLKTR